MPKHLPDADGSLFPKLVLEGLRGAKPAMMLDGDVSDRHGCLRNHMSRNEYHIKDLKDSTVLTINRRNASTHLDY